MPLDNWWLNHGPIAPAGVDAALAKFPDEERILIDRFLRRCRWDGDNVLISLILLLQHGPEMILRMERRA